MGDAADNPGTVERPIIAVSRWAGWATDPTVPMHRVLVFAAVLGFVVAWLLPGRPWLPGAAMVACMIPFGLAVLFFRQGWVLDGHGLREHRLIGRRPSIPWTDLQSIESTPAALVIATRQGEVVIPWALRSSRALAAALREHFDQSTAEREPLDHASIESWLGLGEGQSLVLGRSPVLGIAGRVAGAALLLALAWLGIRLRRPELFGVVPGLVVPYLFAAFRPTRWRVDRDGFHLQSHHIAWTDLVSLQPKHNGWLVETTTVPIRLTGKHAARIAKVVEQVLAEQPAPVVTPGRMEASDRALSRADTPAEAAERGLSTLR